MGEAKVYVETTVISYLTSRPSRDVVVAGHQQVTRDWWETKRQRFHLVISELVVQEASAGDPEASAARLHVLEDLEVLEISEDARVLASKLVEAGPIPKKAVEDALHIGVAVTNGVEYLLTWNQSISRTPRCDRQSRKFAGRTVMSRRPSARQKSCWRTRGYVGRPDRRRGATDP